MKNRREELQSYRRFETPSDVSVWIEAHYSQNELDQFDINKNPENPLSWYKGGAYSNINRAIRENCIERFETVDINAIQQQIQRMRIPESIVVTRFVSIKEFDYLYWHTMFKKTL